MINFAFPRTLQSSNEIEQRRKWLNNLLDIPNEKKQIHYYEYFNKEIIPVLQEDGFFVVLKEATKGIDICHTHAFQYEMSNDELENKSVESVFIEKLKNEYCERNASENARNGDVVVYGVKHPSVDLYYLKHSARLIKEDLVESKWGGGGVLQHRIWDVPKRYGDHISFFYLR